LNPLAAKVLLVVLLEEGNGKTAMEASVTSAAMEGVAMLELLCTAPSSTQTVR
jgi:hypothetical protein